MRDKRVLFAVAACALLLVAGPARAFFGVTAAFLTELVRAAQQARVENAKALMDTLDQQHEAETAHVIDWGNSMHTVVEGMTLRSADYWDRSLLRYERGDLGNDRCGIIHGAQVAVPFGAYDGNNVLGVWEDYVNPGTASPTVYGAVLGGSDALTAGDRVVAGVRTDEAHAPPSGGWLLEPNGILSHRWLAKETPTASAGVQSCHAIERFAYQASDSGLRFQQKGIEHACDYSIDAPRGAHLCGVQVNGACQASAFYSTEGHVDLDLSDRQHPVLRKPDGSIEVMRPSGRYSGRPFGVQVDWVTARRLDRNGNQTVFDYDDDGLVTQVTDARGRKTLYQRDAAGRVIAITQPGAGNLARTWSYTWRTLAFQQNAAFPELVAGGGLCHSQIIGAPTQVPRDVPAPCPDRTITLTTLGQVTVPDGRVMRLDYTAFGALSRVTSIDGGVVDYGYGDASATPRAAPYGYGERDCPGGLFSTLRKRAMSSTTVWPDGTAGPSYTTRFSTGAEETTRATAGRGVCKKLRWELTQYADGHSLEEAYCYENSHDLRSRDASYWWTSATAMDFGLNDQVVAQRIRDRAGAIVEEHAFVDFTSGVPKLAWETASPDLPGGAYLDLRHDSALHERDGVRWSESFEYDRSGPAATGGARTYGNVVGSVTRGQDGSVLRRVTRSFSTDPSYLRRNLVALPTRETLLDDSGTALSTVELGYDESPLSPSGAAHLDRSLVGAQRGNPTSQRVYHTLPKDRHPATSRTTYFDNGAIASSTDRLGNVTTHGETFGDCDASPISEGRVTNALGQVTRSRLDCASELLLSTTAPSGAMSCTQYDREGRPVESAGPGDALSRLPDGVRDPQCATSGSTQLGSNGAGPAVWTEYLDLGAPGRQRIVAHRKNGTAAGHVSVSFLDGTARVVQVQSELDPGSTEGGHGVAMTQVVFDEMGRTARRDLPCGLPAVTAARASCSAQRVELSYDAIGRVIRSSEPGGLVTTTRYGASSDGHFLSAATDPRGHETRTVADALGQVLRIERDSPSCGGVCTTALRHDAAGRLLQISDPAGNTVRYGYDGLGRRTELDDPDSGHTHLEYDDAGNVTARVDARGQRVESRYDRLNRLVREDLPPQGPGEEDLVLTYDGTPPTCAVAPACTAAPGQVCCARACDAATATCLQR